jgi:flagellar biosynthesis anti-sigma factor FlgM
MKIDEHRPTILDQIGGATTAATSRSTAQQTTETSDRDTVALSPAARGLTELRAQIGDPGEIDQARVSSLRASLASGAYQPSLDAVAESLLREVAANSIA